VTERIRIFDTTLRDGEQSPGSALGIEKKIEFAQQLARLNVDVIEAGFPVASADDYEAVKQISSEVQDCTICAFARSVEKDILSASDALKNSSNGRIQIVTPISDDHLATRLRISREDGLHLIRKSIEFALDRTNEVTFIGEDSSRADPKYRLQCFEAAAKAGASVLTYADTVGYATPEAIFNDINHLVRDIGSPDVGVGIHCHNDLGIAVANSLSAVLAGACEVQCTVNGVGERAGNAALEEVVMGLYVREDLYQAKTEIDTSLLILTSRLLAQYTGIEVPINKAVVGQNAFAHCSGMHQHGVLIHPPNYEIMSPDVVGASHRHFIIGRHSGKHGVRHVLSEMGYKVNENALLQVMGEIKNILAGDEYLEKDDLVVLYEKYIELSRV
jgi:2-isopropylmalate synthase